MKKLSNTTLIVGALVFAVVLIIGGNILSGKEAVPGGNGGGIHGQAASALTNQVAGQVDSISGTEEALAPDFTLKNLKGEDVTLAGWVHSRRDQAFNKLQPGPGRSACLAACTYSLMGSAPNMPCKVQMRTHRAGSLLDWQYVTYYRYLTEIR